MELFRPGLFRDGETVMYLDLDTVLLRPFDIPPPPDPGTLQVVQFPRGWTKYGSGVMLWQASYTVPYASFAADAARFMAVWNSDQEALFYAVLHSGGNVEAMPLAQVQAVPGNAGIPMERPHGPPIFAFAGVTAKPWDLSRAWIPQTIPTGSTVADTALIAVLFGDDHAIIDATRRTAIALARMDPKPSIMVLVETISTGETRVPEWPGERVLVPVDDSYGDIFHKERLYDIGAEFAARRPGIAKYVFADVDVAPARGQEDWILLASDALDRCELVHPWTTVAEEDGSSAWMSYSAAVASGATGIWCGQGFCTAMTREFYERSGGWATWAVSGSGDSVAMHRWDATRNCGDAFRHVRWMQELCDAKPALTRFGYCPGELVHAWHGARRGPNDTRRYNTRYWPWEWAGGPERVHERGIMGLVRWQDTPLARATRQTVQRRLSCVDRSALRKLWAEACAEYGAEPGRDSVWRQPRTPELAHSYQLVWGWCDFEDCYRRLVQSAPEGATLVEMGVYFGKSTCFLAVEAWNARKRLRIVAIDPFPPMDSGEAHFVSGKAGFPASATGYERAVQNIAATGAGSLVDLRRADGHEQAAQFADGSLWAVWIDADHNGQSTLEFCREWWPKVAAGGWLGLHDYINGAWPEVRGAVDRWAAETGLPIAVYGRSAMFRKAGVQIVATTNMEARDT